MLILSSYTTENKRWTPNLNSVYLTPACVTDKSLSISYTNAFTSSFIKFFILHVWLKDSVQVYKELRASLSSRTPSSRTGLELRLMATLWCSPWLWDWWGPLQSSLKQHSSFISPLLMWDLSQKDLYAHDFITESVVRKTHGGVRKPPQSSTSVTKTSPLSKHRWRMHQMIHVWFAHLLECMCNPADTVLCNSEAPGLAVRVVSH